MVKFVEKLVNGQLTSFVIPEASDASLDLISAISRPLFGNATIVGTDADDRVIVSGGVGNYTLNMKAGDDIVVLDKAGNDAVNAGDGNDYVSLRGYGNDTVHGGNGNDIIQAGDGNDVITDIGTASGTFHNSLLHIVSPRSIHLNWHLLDSNRVTNVHFDNLIEGGFGNDVISTGATDDFIYGDDRNTTNDWYGRFAGNDRINAGAGNDIIYGGFGNDTINGGDGDDVIIGSLNNSTIAGGNGDDFIQNVSGVSTGGAGHDVFYFDSADLQATSALSIVRDFNVNEDMLALRATHMVEPGRFGESFNVDAIDRVTFDHGNTNIFLKNFAGEELQVRLLGVDQTEWAHVQLTSVQEQFETVPAPWY